MIFRIPAIIKNTVTLTSGVGSKRIYLDLNINDINYKDTDILLIDPNFCISKNNIKVGYFVNIEDLDGKKFAFIDAKYNRHLGDSIIIRKGFEFGYIRIIRSEI